MTHTPTPQNRKPEVASIVLLLTAVMLFFFGGQYYVKFRAVAQALGVFCLALAAFFIIKRLTVYTYTVYPKDRDTKKSVSELTPDELTLTVSKRYGAGRETNRAQLDLAALKSVVTLPAAGRERRKILKEHGKAALYYYTVTFRPNESTLLVFEQKGAEKILVVIEPDGDFKGFLEEAARINNNRS